jgi:hypothetical protein
MVYTHVLNKPGVGVKFRKRLCRVVEN